MLYSFGAGTDGTAPAAGLIVQSGFFYGTTSGGGASGLGTVFKINARTGTETILHSFGGGNDGAEPFAPLVYQNGILYGTTFFGGASNDGTVFKVDAETGAETVLHAFEGAPFNGNPAAGLTAQDGILYGTTAHGGVKGCGGSGCGTVFAVDATTGAETVLYAFKNQVDGEDPEGGLVYRDGFLYGTTQLGGVSGRGTVFRLETTTGAVTQLHDFESVRDGTNPGTLLYAGGQLFGTTRNGGVGGCGTVFKIQALRAATGP